MELLICKTMKRIIYILLSFIYVINASAQNIEDAKFIIPDSASISFLFNNDSQIEKLDYVIKPQPSGVLLCNLKNGNIFPINISDTLSNTIYNIPCGNNGMNDCALLSNGTTVYTSGSHLYYLDKKGTPMPLLQINGKNIKIKIRGNDIYFYTEKPNIIYRYRPQNKEKGAPKELLYTLKNPINDILVYSDFVLAATGKSIYLLSKKVEKPIITNKENINSLAKCVDKSMFFCTDSGLFYCNFETSSIIQIAWFGAKKLTCVHNRLYIVLNDNRTLVINGISNYPKLILK